MGPARRAPRPNSGHLSRLGASFGTTARRRARTGAPSHASVSIESLAVAVHHALNPAAVSLTRRDSDAAGAGRPGNSRAVTRVLTWIAHGLGHSSVARRPGLGIHCTAHRSKHLNVPLPTPRIR